MPLPIQLEDHNLLTAERRLIEDALITTGTIRAASQLLGISPDSTKRRMIKLGVSWRRQTGERMDRHAAEETPHRS